MMNLPEEKRRRLQEREDQRRTLRLEQQRPQATSSEEPSEDSLLALSTAVAQEENRQAMAGQLAIALSQSARVIEKTRVGADS